MIKLGFTAADLTSQDRIFRKWGEITVAKIPERISLTEIVSHSWSEPAKYEQAKAAFEALGFSRSSKFMASPQTWVIEFWLTSQPRLFAKIIDSSERGVYSEVSVAQADGSIASFENTEDCGLNHREPDKWVHCGVVMPAELVDRALRERSPGAVDQMDIERCVKTYEQSVNEYLAWRRSVGINADEMKRAFERQKKKQRSRSPVKRA